MVSISIVSFNTKEYLKACLFSIYQQLQKIEFEVIVVDNASSDGSVEMIEKDFKDVLLIKNKENAGFGKGHNIGIAKARGDFVFVFNSDAKLVDASLTEMVLFLEKNPRIGVVGGRLEQANGTVERSAGSFYTFFNVVFMLFGAERVGFIRHAYKAEKEVDWVSGGCMLVRRSFFEQLNGFDDNLFMYMEDMEFCYRVKKEGFEVWYYPKMKVIHASFGSSNKAFAIVQIYKGILYFYKKHIGGVQYEVIRGLLVLKAASALCFGIVFRNRYLIDTYKKALRVAL